MTRQTKPKPSKAKQALGRWGEEQAARYLEGLGYHILARNLRTPYGEIDLVAYWEEDNNPPLTLFVEVKTRRSRTFGYPEVSVSPIKQEHFRAAVQHFIQAHPEMRGDWRIDVIAVESYVSQSPQITHFENAFS